MAALQELARALRNNFMDETITIQLSEILKFIDNQAKASAQSAEGKVVEKPPQNAKLTRKSAPETRQNTTQKPPKPKSKEAIPELSQQKKGPSYAEIAKEQPKKPPKPTTPPALPKSLQNRPNPPQPLKVVLRESLKETPSELINKIKALDEGKRIIPLIKALKPLGKRLLLVYPRDL